MKKGFTLIELLVVVLIIGILSAIALPQYTAAVEKARLSEALQNISVMEKQMDLYIMENGLPSGEKVSYKDFAAVDLSGGSWNADASSYRTDNFLYSDPSVYAVGGYIEVVAQKANYSLLSATENLSNFDAVKVGNWYHSCFTWSNNLGRKICKQLESQGWGYHDFEY